jgi:hypothetical protein
MFVSRYSAVLVVAAMIALPALTGRAQDRDGPQPRGPQTAQVRGLIRAVDTAKNTITLAIPNRGREAPEEKTFTLGKHAEVLVDAGRGPFVRKEVKLADLPTGAVAALTLEFDGKTVESVFAEGPSFQGTVKAIDAGKRTVTLMLGGFGRGEEAPEKTFSVSKKAEIGIDDGRGRRFSMKEGKLADIQTGALVSVKLSLDQKTVESMTATGPHVFGVVKAVDVAKHTITLKTPPRNRGEDEEEKTWTLAKDADVLVDEGRGGRGFGRAAKLSDLVAGAVVTLKLSVDQKSAVVVRASGPTVFGQLKSVDAGKRTVTVLVGAGRGSDGEEKTFTLAKKARVFSEGKPIKLAEVKAKGDTLVSLQLSLDQKEVKSVTVVVPRARE